jgi:caffeoyl-CoA O-methyltransferase
MSSRTGELSPQLHAYLLAHSAPADPVLRELADETARRFPSAAVMQIGAEQGTFMTLLTRIAGVTDAVEVGTFTGYSSICLARGLADGGQLLCCDVSEEWTSIARRYWQQAGVAEIVPRIRPGGIILVDNTLYGGQVIDLADQDASVQGIRDFNDHAAADDRVELVLLPVGDGLTLARKSPASRG